MQHCAMSLYIYFFYKMILRRILFKRQNVNYKNMQNLLQIIKSQIHVKYEID